MSGSVDEELDAVLNLEEVVSYMYFCMALMLIHYINHEDGARQ